MNGQKSLPISTRVSFYLFPENNALVGSAETLVLLLPENEYVWSNCEKRNLIYECPTYETIEKRWQNLKCKLQSVFKENK